MRPIRTITIAALVLITGCAAAQEQSEDAAMDLDWPQVKYVVATEVADGSWRFDVTVEHNDEGWDHYADAWQVAEPDEDLLIAERILAHPHDTEQPFTRSLTKIEIPTGITTVVVRARCTVHGVGPVVVLVDLAAAEGEHFEVVSPGAAK